MWFFFNFVYWTNFSVFCQRISHIIVKTESYVSTGNLGRKIIFFEKTLAVLIVFGNERTISSFWQNFSAGLRKLLSTCPWVTFENFFWKKNQTYFSILARWANPFRHSFEDIRAGLLENTILIFNHFRILSKKFPLYWRKKAVELSKLLFTCLQEQFENNIFLKKSPKFFLSSWETKPTKLLDFSQSFFQWVCRKCFLRVHRNFCVEKYFLKKL